MESVHELLRPSSSFTASPHLYFSSCSTLVPGVTSSSKASAVLWLSCLIKPDSSHQAGAPSAALRLDMALGHPGLGTNGHEEP